MRILLASSEVHPYSKSGGLADMVGALAKFLAKAGHQVAMVSPLYRGIREQFPEVRPFDWHLDLPLGGHHEQAGVWSHAADANLTHYFIDHRGFYDRESLYGVGWGYEDNAERYIFFSKAVVNLARYMPLQPQLVHVHDWQTGLVPLMMLHQKWHEGWSAMPRTCMTIHNLAYQGMFGGDKYGLTNLPMDYFHPGGAEFYGALNCLKAGIVHSDLITTVSPRYAREITTEEFGCSLDGVLRSRQSVLIGILNGVDYEEWRTTGNAYLSHPYDIGHMDGKQADKAELQLEMGLPIEPEVPLFGCVTRLTDQKGLDIQLAALEEMLSANMQFVLLGSGGMVWEDGYRKLAARHPGKIAIKFGFNQGLSHRIEAGCDFYLMPSRFEPCGLNQMYSLRYGTIPVVRRTGGLDDSVTDISESIERADGIKFTEYSARALSNAIRKALVLYADKPLLDYYRHNAMSRDYSWELTAARYEDVYRRVVPEA